MTSRDAQGEVSPSGSFVDRERELSEVHAGVPDVTAGHDLLFLLRAKPGIGKTRLADKFGRLAVAQEVRAVWAGCWDASAPACWPWTQIVRGCPADTDAAARSAILGAEATPQVA